MRRQAPALAETTRAIELYTAGPAVQRSYGVESLARIDAAMAHLLDNSLDGRALAGIGLGLADPLADGLRGAHAELLRDRADRGPL